MLKLLLTVFLVAHGLAHALLAAAPEPGNRQTRPGAFFTTSARSWLLPRLGLKSAAIRWLGLGLVALVSLGFVTAGLDVSGILGSGEVWRALAGISAGLSLLLIILFWHPWLVLGVLIDGALLIIVLGTNWLQEAVVT